MLLIPASQPAPDERRPAAPLRGKNIACLGWSGGEPGAQALEAAATGLGARLAWLTGFDAAPDPSAQAAAWALLGQLYDAVVCAGSDGACCEALERKIGVPVVSAATVADGQWPAVLLDRVRR